MTTPQFSLTHPTVQVYFQNLGQAARTFGAALVAAPQAAEQLAAAAPAPSLKVLDGNPSESRAAAGEILNSLASQFESTQPNQAAELRWLASHG